MDFPGKTLVLTMVATLALAGVAWYAASVPVTDRLARLGVACILGGAIGNLIDRATAGYVLDYRGRLVARLALLGLQRGRRRHSDRRRLDDFRSPGAGTPCIQSCLSSDRSPIYSYGVLLAAAYLLGLWMAARRARQAGLDANKVLDLGIWVIIAALVGAKALLFVVDFRAVHEQLAGVHDAAAVGRRVLRRADRGGRRLHLPAAQAQAAAVDVGRSVRARHRARLHGRAARLSDGRLLLRQADRRRRGRSRSPTPLRNLNVGTPLNVPLHPTQLYESLAGLDHLSCVLLVIERRGRQFPGRTFWLFVLLYSVSRFVIEFYRGDDRGMVVRHAVDVAVHLGRARRRSA